MGNFQTLNYTKNERMNYKTRHLQLEIYVTFHFNNIIYVFLNNTLLDFQTNPSIRPLDERKVVNQTFQIMFF